MDYDTVQQILDNYRIANDPAFNDVEVAIEPIEVMNGRCPLGLYYRAGEISRNSVITLPPNIPINIGVGVTLHEFGHRHGDYYANDLSERYAESYRARHQKGVACLYQSTDLSNLRHMSPLYQDGDRGAISMVLNRQVSPDELQSFAHQLALHSEGEQLPKISYSNSPYPVMNIEFTEGVAWPLIIGSVLVAGVVIPFGVLVYAVYKINTENSWVLPVMVVGAVSLLLLTNATKRGLGTPQIRAYNE